MGALLNESGESGVEFSHDELAANKKGGDA